MFSLYAANPIILGASGPVLGPFKAYKTIHAKGPAQNTETEANDSL